MKQFKKHIELNKNDSSFTATATCYYGLAYWDKNKKGKQKECFLRINDCHSSVNIHANYRRFDKDEMKAYKNKLKKLEKFIRDFRKELPDNIK